MLTKLAYTYASDQARAGAHAVANSALSRAAAAVARVACPVGVDAAFIGAHVASILRDQAPSVLNDSQHSANRFIDAYWHAINQVASVFARGQQLDDDEVRAIVADSNPS